MKVAIYIEDGVQQIVLTPETEYEKDVVHGFGRKISRVQVFDGSFYDCRGGWIRQSAYYPARQSMGSFDRSDCSIIMRLDKEDK